MATALLKFDLDRTGVNPDNLISEEVHSTLDQSTGILIPKLGDFFTESLIITNKDDVELVRGTDFIPIEFNQLAALDYGKEIHSAILIIQDKDLYPFSVTYQVLGGGRTYSSANLIAVAEEKVLPSVPTDYFDLFDVPDQFPHSKHFHDIDEIYGFEFIAAALKRIEQAILRGSYPAFRAILGFIDTALFKVKTDMHQILDDRMTDELIKFKDKFTKEYFEIDLIPNLSKATEVEGFNAGKLITDYDDIVENKLMTTEAMIGLKNIFFQSFVRKQMTGLDMTRSVYGPPTAITVRDLTNRSTITIISKLIASENDVVFDDSVYPIELPIENELIIMKLSNGFTNGDGDILGFDQIKGEIYHGKVYQDWNEVKVKWKNNFTFQALQEVKTTIEKHIEDNLNPHEVTKEQVGLGKVVNLPVVTKEELDNITSVRKYMTFESLMYFMKTHLLQNGTKSPVTSESNNKFLIDNAVVVYSPGGGCSADPDPYVTGLNTIIPTSTNIGWSVNGGKPNTKFKMTTGLIGFEQITTEYTLNSVGSYVGYLSSTDRVGTIQSLFEFSGGKSILTNTIVEQTDCVEDVIVVPPVDRPYMAKLSELCVTGVIEPSDFYNPYQSEVTPYDKNGSYGYTSTNPFTEQLEQILDYDNADCGTTGYASNYSLGNNRTAGINTDLTIVDGEPYSLVHFKIGYSDQGISIYTTGTYDEYGEITLPIYTSNISQTIYVQISSEDYYRNLGIFSFAVTASDEYDPYAEGPEGVVYINTSTNNPHLSETTTVNLIITGTDADSYYSIRYFNPATGMTIYFPNAPTDFRGNDNITAFTFNIDYDSHLEDRLNLTVRVFEVLG